MDSTSAGFDEISKTAAKRNRPPKRKRPRWTAEQKAERKRNKLAEQSPTQSVTQSVTAQRNGSHVLDPKRKRSKLTAKQKAEWKRNKVAEQPPTQSVTAQRHGSRVLRSSTTGGVVATKRPLLVLLDLNGTLVHRKTSQAAFAVRPGALSMLKTLLHGGCADVGFCTSMQPKNAKRAVRTLASHAGHTDKALARKLRTSPIFAGDAYHFRNDVGVPLLPLRVPDLAPWRLLRDLSAVWSDPRANGHSAESTVLVDDTPGKCPLHAGSALIVASWDGPADDDDGCEGNAERAASASQSVRELGRLASHLIDAAAAQAAPSAAAAPDVRAWLAAHPFESSGARATAELIDSDG